MKKYKEQHRDDPDTWFIAGLVGIPYGQAYHRLEKLVKLGYIERYSKTEGRPYWHYRLRETSQ